MNEFKVHSTVNNFVTDYNQKQLDLLAKISSQKQ